MTRTLDEIRDEAMALPVEERSWLAEDLWDSLRTAEQRGIDAAWIKEAERRIEEHEAGKGETVPADEFFRALRAKHAPITSS